MQATASNCVHCDFCDGRVRETDCKKQFVVHVVVSPSDGNAIELVIFHNTIESIIRDISDDLTEDEVAEYLLAMEDLKFKYDPKKMAITKFLQ